ncbi:hypothetical protein KCP78_13370 [Salmonella enterica subsp. enterica]|nr:hypothetical protein KCP78_13370 [Salmonella enterica subsp. enterica]
MSSHCALRRLRWPDGGMNCALSGIKRDTDCQKWRSFTNRQTAAGGR